MSQPPTPPPPYGAPMPYGPPPPYGYTGQDHPQATTTLILGILGLVLCQVLSPFAWVMGTRVVREIDSSGGQYGGRSLAQAGRICGIIGTVLLVVSLVVVVAIVVLSLGFAATSP